MKSFELTDKGFIIDGTEQPFLSGEIHYFRMPKRCWSDALDRLIDCGCNAVSFYVPWFVHEYEEGKYDFVGKVHESNDLHYWMRLIKEKGLMAFFRPGPYIYSESRDLGIPRWFGEHYPNAHIQAYKNGEYVPFGLEYNSSHNHPYFIRAVTRWYETVCSEFARYQVPEGSIVMFQLCNEIPNDDIDDRNRENLGIGDINGLFPGFLREKYDIVANLNKAYGAHFSKLELVEPHMLEEHSKDRYFNDHLEFYYGSYYPHYFRTLADIARRNGITVPLVHNAYNPRAVSLHYHNKRKNPWLNIGVDCYYSMSGRLGIKDIVYYCEFGAEYIKRFLKNTPWVIEQESGYWNDYPVVYGPELYIWNIWTMAAGYKGFNMYLFASGQNRPGMGFYGTDHNWQAPVGEYGEKQSSFDDIRRSIMDIKAHSDVFMSENRYDIALGIKNSHGLIWRDISKVSSEAYFALRSTGFTPRISDFTDEGLETLKQYETLWIISDESMDEDVQRKLCDYIRQGGKLIVQGTIPYKNECGDDCTYLADELGVKVYPHKDQICHQQKLLCNDKEYFIGRTIQRFEGDDKYTAAKDDINNKPAVAIIPYGMGSTVLMPFRIDMLFFSFTECILHLLGKINISPAIKGSRMLGVIRKVNGKNIILNPHPVKIEEELTIDSEILNVRLEPHSFMII